jgi:hypothetical protein
VLPESISLKYVYVILFLFFSLQFVISRILLLADVSFQPKFIFEIGGIWFAAVLYFFIIALFVDLIRLADYFFKFLPNLKSIQFKILLSAIFLVFILLTIGYFNATSPEIKTLNLKINKKSELKTLKIVMVSDIHFGTIIGYSEIKRMLEMIEKEKPDIFFSVGDFTDEGITKSKIDELKPLFDNLKPRFGKIAILGNHEYYNKIEKTLPIFNKLNIKLLRDSFLNFENEFVVVGRDDKSKKQATGIDRESLKDLMQNVNTDLPIILLDHQPYALSETAKFPIDIQLSGHTHNGQMFPLNFLTKSIYEISWGYLKKGNTQFYVSSGFGTWGPRIRIGTTPEIVIINIEFIKN